MGRVRETLHDALRQTDAVLLALCVASTLYGMVLIASATSFRGTLKYVAVQGLGLLIGLVLYFFLSSIDVFALAKQWKWLLGFNVGTSPAAMVMMVVMIPAMLFAMYEKNGQPLEVVIRNIYRVCFQRPKQRPYKTNNFYAVLERQNQLDREVYQIVRKEKADPRRTKTDRSRHRKSEPNG